MFIATFRCLQLLLNICSYLSIFIVICQCLQLLSNVYSYFPICIAISQYSQLPSNDYSYFPIFIATFQYAQLSLNIHSYFSIFIATSQYSQLLLNIHSYFSIFIAISQSSQLLLNVYSYLSIFIDTCQYSQLHVNVHNCMSMFIATCKAVLLLIELLVSWKSPTKLNGLLLQYILLVDSGIEYTGLNTSYTLTNLSPYTQYRLVVQACTGQFSTIIIFISLCFYHSLMIGTVWNSSTYRQVSEVGAVVKVIDSHICRWGSINNKSCSFFIVSLSKGLSLVMGRVQL